MISADRWKKGSKFSSPVDVRLFSWLFASQGFALSLFPEVDFLGGTLLLSCNAMAAVSNLRYNFNPTRSLIAPTGSSEIIESTLHLNATLVSLPV